MLCSPPSTDLQPVMRFIECGWQSTSQCTNMAGKPVQVQGSNIRHYYAYLLVRAKAYRDTKIDWVREGQGRLKKQTIEKGLLRETETVQSQISSLLKCDVSLLYHGYITAS